MKHVSRRRLPRRATSGSASGRVHCPYTVLMPSYVNIGAYVDEGTMVIPGRPSVPVRRLVKTSTFPWRGYRRRAGAAAG